MRYQILTDQLDIYHRHQASWSIWTYKDVGLQGLVHTDPAGPYMRRFGELIAKKARLGVDSWGSTDQEVPAVMDPVHRLVAEEFPELAPVSVERPQEHPHGSVRHVLFAQAMVPEYEYASCSAGSATTGSMGCKLVRARGLRPQDPPLRHPDGAHGAGGTDPELALEAGVRDPLHDLALEQEERDQQRQRAEDRDRHLLRVERAV